MVRLTVGGGGGGEGLTHYEGLKTVCLDQKTILFCKYQIKSQKADRKEA